MHMQCDRWLIDLWGCAKTQASATSQRPGHVGLVSNSDWYLQTRLYKSLQQHQSSMILPSLLPSLPLPNRWTGLLSSSVCYGASNYARSPHQTLTQHAFSLLWAGRGLVSWNRGTHGMWLWLCGGRGRTRGLVSSPWSFLISCSNGLV